MDFFAGANSLWNWFSLNMQNKKALEILGTGEFLKNDSENVERCNTQPRKALPVGFMSEGGRNLAPEYGSWQCRFENTNFTVHVPYWGLRNITSSELQNAVRNQVVHRIFIQMDWGTMGPMCPFILDYEWEHNCQQDRFACLLAAWRGGYGTYPEAKANDQPSYFYWFTLKKRVNFNLHAKQVATRNVVCFQRARGDFPEGNWLHHASLWRLVLDYYDNNKEDRSIACCTNCWRPFHPNSKSVQYGSYGCRAKIVESLNAVFASSIVYAGVVVASMDNPKWLVMGWHVASVLSIALFVMVAFAKLVFLSMIAQIKGQRPPIRENEVFHLPDKN